MSSVRWVIDELKFDAFFYIYCCCYVLFSIASDILVSPITGRACQISTYIEIEKKDTELVYWIRYCAVFTVNLNDR